MRDGFLAMMRPTALDQVIVRAQSGDAAAFCEIVALYRSRLIGFFRGLVFDTTKAEELAQDTLSHLFLKLQRYDPRGTFDAWIFSVARHLAIDRIRKERLLKGQPLGESQEWLADEARPYTRAFGRPGEEMEREETIRMVREALAKVPAVYRETLQLADIEGVPYELIAERQRTSVGTVKSRVFRGRAALASNLDILRSRQRLESLVA